MLADPFAVQQFWSVRGGSTDGRNRSRDPGAVRTGLEANARRRELVFLIVAESRRRSTPAERIRIVLALPVPTTARRRGRPGRRGRGRPKIRGGQRLTSLIGTKPIGSWCLLCRAAQRSGCDHVWGAHIDHMLHEGAGLY